MPFILIAIVLLVIFSWLYVWYTRNIWFYRDPKHPSIAKDAAVILSPVYGRVVYVKQIRHGVVISDKKGEEIPISEITKSDWPSECPDGEGWLIGIAMTPLDVHFQYASVNGTMGEIKHFQHGKNLPMFDMWEYVQITWLRRWVQLWAKKYIIENERQTMWISAERVKVALVLIADKFVSKITTHTSSGKRVNAGEKISFIDRGSQVDVVVCGHPGLEIFVKDGDRALGPLTVLARIP